MVKAWTATEEPAPARRAGWARELFPGSRMVQVADISKRSEGLMTLRPWLPDERASDLDVWNVWNRPITGTFVLDGVTILFDLTNVADEDDERWVYVELNEQDVVSLKGKIFEDVFEMRDLIDSLVSSDRRSWIRTAQDFAVSE